MMPGAMRAPALPWVDVHGAQRRTRSRFPVYNSWSSIGLVSRHIDANIFPISHDEQQRER